MQRLEVSGAVRPLYESLGVKRLTELQRMLDTAGWHYMLRGQDSNTHLGGISCKRVSFERECSHPDSRI